jgi:ribonuclease VapC
LIADSSAVIALLRRESTQLEVAEKLVSANVVAIGAPTLFETTMVMVGRVGDPGRGLVLQFLADFEVEVTPFGATHWKVASEAFARFGKGRHPAGLNYGDCMAYAMARVSEQPLLFVGDDFAHTDIDAA